MQLPEGCAIYLSNTVILTTGARQVGRKRVVSCAWALASALGVRMSAYPSKANVLWYSKPSSVWATWTSACTHQLALNGFWATMFKVVCLCPFGFSFLCNHVLGLRKDTCPSVKVPVLSLWSVMRWWVTSQRKQTNEEGHCLFLALTWECGFSWKSISCFALNEIT